MADAITTTWIEVFKSGEHTDASGNTRTWTKEDLETIVSNYSESLKANGETAEASLVKGHPETDDPALGWAKELKIRDDGSDNYTLLAKIEFTDANFVQEIKDKKYKRVSIKLDGDLNLKHIGFLGAVHPAVTGMEPVKLNASDKNMTVIQFCDCCVFEESIANPPQVDPLQALKDAQIERSKLYGIDVKQGFGSIEKPKVYADIDEAQFADPVHYLYPLNDKANLISSFSLFNSWEVREKYSDIERQAIRAKFIRAADELKIPMEPVKLWMFNDKTGKGEFAEILMPVDKLSKKQLEDFITEKISTINSDSKAVSKNFGENMTKQEWEQAKLEALTKWVNDNVSPEKASEFQAFATEWAQNNPEPTEENTASGDDGGMQANANPQFAEMQSKIDKLERENRIMKFEDYVNRQIEVEHRLMPAQKEHAIALLEFSATNAKGGFTFNDNGKQKTFKGDDLIRSFIESFSKRDDLFAEFASKNDATNDKPSTMKAPANAVIDSNSSDLHKKIVKFQEEQKSLGINLTYDQAIVAYSMKNL